MNTMEIVINSIAIAKNYTKKNEIKTITLENGEKKARIALSANVQASTGCKAFYAIIINNKIEKVSEMFTIVGERTIEKFIRSLIEDLN